MKKLILPIMILGTCAAHAGVLPTAGVDHNNRERTGNRLGATTARMPTKESTPTLLYISAKGGYNMMLGQMFVGEDSGNPSGWQFSKNNPMFVGAVGIDFNRDPSIRLELEIVHNPTTTVKFGKGWDSLLNADVGFTSFAFNFIPYFKINDTMDFNLVVGLGAASLDFKDPDESDFMYMKAGKAAFVFNLGAGLDIKITDNFSILPEFRYSPLMTTIDYNLYGLYKSTGNSFFMHNLQFLAGVKFTF